MTISVVVVNHNGSETILHVIESILNQKQDYEKIILVDNNSQDGSVEAIGKHYPMVQVIMLKENCGLPYARNTGLSYTKSDFVLFVDDDVLLTDNCLEQMMSAMQEVRASVVCPRVMLYPENNTIQCDGAMIHFTGMLSLRHAYVEVEKYTPKQSITKGFIGACMLFDAKVLRYLGGFDEDFFFYFEDMELSYRFMALGYKICCEERAVVLHERGVGTEDLSFRGTGNYPLPRAYFNFRHRWLTLLIHYQIKTLILLSPALFLYEAAAFVESIRRG
jgi:GT2 family glycosyltransferase